MIFSSRENREYFQRVAGANNEVIFALKPGISEGAIPEHLLMQSLIRATARKYRIEAGDAYGIKEIVEDLIKEVMDSSFISSKQKLSFCEQLEKLASPRAEARDEVDRVSSLASSKVAATYRHRLVQYMSVGAGVLSGVLSALLGLTLASTKSTISHLSKEQTIISNVLLSVSHSSTGLIGVPLILSIVALLILELVSLGIPRFRKKKEVLTVSELAGQPGSQGKVWEAVLQRASQRKHSVPPYKEGE